MGRASFGREAPELATDAAPKMPVIGIALKQF